MFEIVFLGTSAAAPSIHRGLSSIAILAGEDRFLVDCGEGTQRQILRSGIGFKRLNHIMLTHSHLDHILGLGGLVSTFIRWENIDEIFVYGGQYTLDRVSTLIYDVVLRQHPPKAPVHMIPVTGGTIFEGKRFSVRAIPVPHRGLDCYGYIFEEHTHHPFLADKAEALGIPAGAERGQLVKGDTVTLADGRTITPDMVLGDPIRGTKIIITGDIADLSAIADEAQDADVLITEATFVEADTHVARETGHITATEAAQFARDYNIRHLLLTHLSRRYREYDVKREARAIFEDARVVRDLDHFRITRNTPLQRVEPASQADEK